MRSWQDIESVVTRMVMMRTAESTKQIYSLSHYRPTLKKNLADQVDVDEFNKVKFGMSFKDKIKLSAKRSGFYSLSLILLLRHAKTNDVIRYMNSEKFSLNRDPEYFCGSTQCSILYLDDYYQNRIWEPRKE